MEVAFAHSYLLLAGKFTVGGLLSLAVLPTSRISRDYYSAATAVYIVMALLMVAGEVYLQLRSEAAASFLLPLPWLLFFISLCIYYASLFLKQPTVRARIFPLALSVGLFALCATAWTFATTDRSACSGIVFAVVVASGAALCGASLSSMLLGHWFLVDQGLDPALLERMRVYCRRCLTAECAAVLLAATLLHREPVLALFAGEPPGLRILLVGRAACWLATAALLAMIGHTIRVPQAMAATGLFYVMTLAVVVGEILSNWLMFRSGLPL